MATSLEFESWLKRCESLIAQRPKDEARAAQKSIAAGQLRHELNVDLETVDAVYILSLARLARLQKDNKAALELLELYLARNLDPRERDNGLLMIAEVCVASSDYEGAVKALSEVKDKKSQKYQNITQKTGRSHAIISASKLFGDAAERLKNGERRNFISDVLQAVDMMHERSYSNNEALRSLVSCLSCAYSPEELCSHSPSKVRYSPVFKPRPIFVAGFGWSGSGAVFDFLRQSQEADVFSDQEILLFGNSARRSQAHANMLFQYGARPRSDYDSVLVDMIGRTVLGLTAQGAENDRIASVTHVRSLMYLFQDEPEKLEKMLSGATDFLVACMCSADNSRRMSVKGAFLRFFGELLGLRSTGRKFMLFSNAVSASEIETMHLMPSESIALVCRRDVRDAYADRFSQGKQWSAELFLRSYSKKQARFRQSMSNPAIRDRTMEVSFEDFVLDSERRFSVLESLGMKREMLSEGVNSFDPNISVKNIGIHKHFKNQGAIQEIEAALADHLHLLAE